MIVEKLHHPRMFHRHTLIAAMHVQYRVAMLRRLRRDISVAGVACDLDSRPLAGQLDRVQFVIRHSLILSLIVMRQSLPELM